MARSDGPEFSSTARYEFSERGRLRAGTLRRLVGIDLNTLVLLVDIVDAGSLAEAARRTGVPKSTLSRKVTEIEAELGVRLLQRTSRKLGLTEPGRRLLTHARRIAQDIGEAKRAVRAHADAPRGVVRVTASVSMAERVLAPIFVEFLEDNPDIDLDLRLSPTVSDLIVEEIDVAIRVSEPDPSSRMIARRLGYAALYPCASEAYLQRAGVPTELEELRDHDAIVYRPGGEEVSWVLERAGEAPRRVAPRTRMAVNSHPVARMAVLGGLGIGLLPAPWCSAELADGRLIRVLPPYRTPLRWVYAAFPSREAPLAVRAFVDFVAARMGQSEEFVLPQDAGGGATREI